MSPDNVTPTPTPEPEKPRCPECDAWVHDPRATRCWLCHEPFGGRPRDPDDELLGRLRAPESKGDSALWVVGGVLGALILLSLGVSGSYGLLILAAFAATPFLIHLAVVSSKRGRGAGAAPPLRHPHGITTAPGSPVPPAAVSGPNPAIGCLVALAAVVTTFVASAIAFYATCLAVCLGGARLGPRGPEGERYLPVLFISAFSAGLFVALLVFLFLKRHTWPRKA